MRERVYLRADISNNRTRALHGRIHICLGCVCVLYSDIIVFASCSKHLFRAAGASRQEIQRSSEDVGC